MALEKSSLNLIEKFKYHTAKGLLKVSFRPSIHRMYKKNPHQQAALSLEEKHGFSGIGQAYHLPNDANGIEMEPLAFEKEILFARDALYAVQEAIGKISHPPKHLYTLEAEYSQQLDQWMNEVHEKNKDVPGIERLHELANSSEYARWNILMGISSGFKPKDIEWFSNGKHGSESRLTTPGYHKVHRRLEENLHYIGFIPAPETLKTLAMQTHQSSKHTSLAPKHSFSANGNTGPEELTLLEINGEKQLINIPPNKPLDVERLTSSHLLRMHERTDHYWQKQYEERQQEAATIQTIK